jgi:flagellar basal-body rod protein FlgF
METSTYIALSGQDARQHQMEVLANNIANLSTPGYKAEQMLFQEYVSKPPGGDPSSYVTMVGHARDMRQGPLTHTGNSLDVALNGPGFFTVTMPNGSSEYTRNGHLQIDSQGELVNSAGLVVQGEGGSPIVIPTGAGQITIGTDGTVATRDATLGKIAVVNFDNPQAMVAESGGLYSTDQTTQPVTATNVEQATIEDANIQPIVEMTKLMNVVHAIGNAKSFVDGEHTRLKNAIDRLGKTI